MFLITAHPRSGTSYTEKLLKQAGFRIGGERYGRRRPLEKEAKVDGVVSWQHIVLYQDDFGPVFHQTRNPLKVIASAQTLHNGSFRKIFKNFEKNPENIKVKMFVRKLFPGLVKKSVIEWAMLSWASWNELIENDSRVVYRYKIEDMETEWSNIMDILGKKNLEKPELQEDINTRKSSYSKIDKKYMEMINPDLTERIISKGRKYGYEL